MASTELKAVITAEDRATPTLKKFGASVASVASGVALGTLAVSGLKAGFGFLTGVIEDSIESFSASEQSVSQLTAVLESTHGAAGLFIEDLTDQATALQGLTTYSDEAVQGAESLLLTFTNVKGAVFQESIPLILDMSTALGQDLKSSAIQLGKALNDPIDGITALRRVGVNFTESQKEQIEVLVKHGKTMEAQRLILAELSTEFGGSALAAGKTFSGQMTILSNSIDDMREKIGGAIVKGITPFVEKIAAFVNSEEGQHFADQITESVTKFFTYIEENQDGILGFFTSLGKVINAVWTVVKWVADEFSAFAGAIANVIAKLQVFVSDVGQNGLFTGLKDLFTFRAEGGPVNSGKPYIVGEKGPELFVPSSSGNIVSNDKMGGGGVTINFNGGVSLASDMDVASLGEMLARQIQLTRMGA